MDERQYWMQRLDEFLRYREDAGIQAGGINDDRSIVGQWIRFALMQSTAPADRNEAQLVHWVTEVKDLTEKAQKSYQSHVNQWWIWNEGASVPTVSGPTQRLERLVVQFRATGYPGEDDQKHLLAREQHERTLRSLDEVSYEDRGDIKPVWATSNQNYGWSGRQPSLDQAINNATEATWSQIRDCLAELCFGSRRLGQERKQKNSRVHGKGYDYGKCGAADDHKSKWGPPACNCGAKVRYKIIKADGHKLRAEKHCKETRAFVWQGQPVDRRTGEVQKDWVPRGEFDDRIDYAVRSVHGLGYRVATKLPAICHPGNFVPLYHLRQHSNEGQALGKLDMIELLDKLELFDVHEASEAQAVVRLHEELGDCGAVIMRSNTLLLEALRAHFTEGGTVDTWGTTRFLYWLSERQSERDESVAGIAAGENVEAWIDDADLATLADNLLCEVRFLNDIVELLEDKRQVILYGPPGTGKTYFARYLAWTLTGIQDDEEYGDDGPYSLVQFHPAYSYEDFFEGYRPAVDDDGQMTYELASGPLVRLAERAEEHPDELHVMVIDEINRANLPRVLGELLYLLEYRDEWTQTQYRPVDGFILPSNVWIIGTMNTADRSIALIDAAMRRRFHFVPFFPDREPTAGLLRRWYEQHAPRQAWIADLLDGVNERLRRDLGGDHLLIGPSHFMKSDLDKDGLRRIWTYNIEPLIEDQFFGRQEVIKHFRFDEVWRHHGPRATAPESEAGAPGVPDEDAESPSEHDDGTTSQDDDSGGNATG